MLELRPNCEHCDRPLPPHSTNAMICSFECTFCTACVEAFIGNVCPNCGGNLCPRPIRPRTKRMSDNCLVHYPPSQTRVFKPKNVEAHLAFRRGLEAIAPQDR